MDPSKVIRVKPQLFKNVEKVKETSDFEGRNIRGFDGNYNKQENRFQEEMRLKPMKYGFHGVGRGPIPGVFCAACDKEIFMRSLKINGVPYHPECFKSS